MEQERGVISVKRHGQEKIKKGLFLGETNVEVWKGTDERRGENHPLPGRGSKGGYPYCGLKIK